jgi:hypothetical protein
VIVGTEILVEKGPFLLLAALTVSRLLQEKRGLVLQALPVEAAKMELGIWETLA